MKNFIKLVFIHILSLTLAIGTLVAFASFPSTTPSGEIAGGLYMSLIKNMLEDDNLSTTDGTVKKAEKLVNSNQNFRDCGTGNYLQGFNSDGEVICSGSPSAPTTPINGVCGSNRGTCSSGSVSWVNNTMSCGTTAIWKCLGNDGGNNSSNCSYYNGSCSTGTSCGTSNGKYFTSKPTSGLCTSGGASWTDSTASDWSYNWKCGSNNCVAYKYNTTNYPGECGDAHTNTYNFSSGLSNAGYCKYSSVEDGLNLDFNTRTWTWDCRGMGYYNNDDNNCYAYQKVNGFCGNWHTTYRNDIDGYNDIPDLCLYVGTSLKSTPVFNSSNNRWEYICDGVYGGISNSCYINGGVTSTAGACSSIDGTTSSTPPTTPSNPGFNSLDWCSEGSFTNYKYNVNSKKISWDCKGTITDSCTFFHKRPGECGTAEGSTYPTKNDVIDGGLCNSALDQNSSESSLTRIGSKWKWICYGYNSGDDKVCYANYSSTSAKCGSATDNKYFEKPTSNLCLDGTPSSPVKYGTIWNWTCITNTSTKSCNASVCGSSSGSHCSAVDGKRRYWWAYDEVNCYNKGYHPSIYTIDDGMSPENPNMHVWSYLINDSSCSN